VLVGEEAQLAQARRLVRQHRRVQDVLHTPPPTRQRDHHDRRERRIDGFVLVRSCDRITLYRAWQSSVLLLLSVLLWTFGTVTPPPPPPWPDRRHSLQLPG